MEPKPVEFEEVEKFLTKEESQHHLALSLRGSPYYNSKYELCVMMGMEAFQAVQDFHNQMIAKYQEKVVRSLVPKPRGPKFTKPKKKRK